MRCFAFTSFVALIFLSSCSERLYYPDRANVPAFREAHEVKAVVSVKPNDGGSNENAAVAPAGDVAYAPANHIGVIASYRSLSNRNAYLYPVYDKPENYSYNNTNVAVSGHLFEGGAGYFTNLSRRGIFEVYGGYGRGLVKGTDKFTTRYNRFFMQTEAGFRNDVVSVMGGIRLAMEKFYSFESDDPTLQYTINASDPSLRTPYDLLAQNFFFIDPFVNAEVGYKYVSFNAQMGFSAQTGHNSAIGRDFPVYASFGVVFHFAPSFLKKEKAKKTRTIAD